MTIMKFFFADRPSQGSIDRDNESPLVVGLRATIASQKTLLEQYQRELAKTDEMERGRLEQLREKQEQIEDCFSEIDALKAANELMASRLEGIAELCDLESCLDDIDGEPNGSDNTVSIIDSAPYGE